MFGSLVSVAHAQPRGGIDGDDLDGDGGVYLVFLFLAAFFVRESFKRSKAHGAAASIACGAFGVLVAYQPQLANSIIGFVVLLFLYVPFRDMSRTLANTGFAVMGLALVYFGVRNFSLTLQPAVTTAMGLVLIYLVYEDVFG